MLFNSVSNLLDLVLPFWIKFYSKASWKDCWFVFGFGVLTRHLISWQLHDIEIQQFLSILKCKVRNNTLPTPPSLLPGLWKPRHVVFRNSYDIYFPGIFVHCFAQGYDYGVASYHSRSLWTSRSVPVCTRIENAHFGGFRCCSIS